MTVVDNVFPQSGDADFAENFAAWVGRGNISSHVETGLSFTVDYAASPPTVDVTEGKSYVLVDQATISSNSETRLALDYAITTGAQTAIPLNGNEQNNLIYVNPNIGTNDNPTFEVETNSGNAGANWLLVGVIDTVNDTSEVRNRNPDADYDALTARDSFGLPVYSEFSEASSSEASTIFIDGNGAPREGVYVNNGNSFISVGAREINQLLDVTGVESITSDTSANRPAAGTQGRLFIDETNNLIQIDTGSSWVDIGTNSSNIGAADLGFDPATQSELNGHISVSGAHHTRPNAGDGLKESSNTFNIEPSDFAGTFLNDNADNLEVRLGFGLENDGSGQIQFDENESYIFPNQQTINGVLTMGNDIDLSNNNLVEPNQIQTSGSGSDSITIQDTFNVAPILTLSEGGEVGVTSGDLTDGGTTTIFDQSASHVPLATLEQDSITINANDGLKSGGIVTLGGSVGLDIEPADFAGTFLSDDGVDNLQVNIGTGVENDGTGNIRVDEDFDFTFTSAIDFSAGLDTQGDISDGTQVIWDASVGEIPDSALGSITNSTLTNDSVTVTAGTDLVGGGSVALGGSITIDHEDTSTQGNVAAAAGAAITDASLDGNGHVTSLTTTDFDGRFVNETGDTMSGNLTAPSFTLTDANADTAQWTVSENATSGNFEIGDGTSTRVNIDNSGNINAEGELTEGAAL